jgi:hypothetical protein
MPRLYNKDQLPLWESLETAVTRVEVGVRWLPVCEDKILRAEECPTLEDVTKQCSEHRD